MKSWKPAESPEGCQISVKAITGTRVLLRDTGPNMVAAQPDSQSFWGFLDSFGGEWVWESVGCGKGLTRERDNSTNRTEDMSWLVDRMKNNTIVWCTDGSYHRKHEPKVSRVGWMAYCTKH